MKALKDIHQGGAYIKDPKTGEIQPASEKNAKNPSPDTGKEKK